MALRLDKNQRRLDRTSVLDESDQQEVNRVAPGSPPAVLIAQPRNAPVTWRYVRDDELDLGLECLLITYNGNKVVQEPLYHLRVLETLEMRQRIVL